MKTAVITGGAGFLGSHLCTFILAKGYRVIAIDNCITGNRKNIEHLKENPNFSFIEHDCTKPVVIEEPVHYVLNFASPASPIDYQKIPIETLFVGAYGTQHALDLAKQKNAVFLQASTSEVYGDPHISPQPETYWGNVNSIGPRSCYDEAKRYGEALVMVYHRKYKIDTKIVRIFNTYGPQMRLNDGRVIPTFIGEALKNKPITVFGDGTQTRSFCYVDDLIRGVYALLLSNINEPVNIGNPEEFTMIDAAKKIIAATKSTSTITFLPLPEDDPKQRCPDITRAKKQLNWQPQISLDEGLKKTIPWFAHQLQKG